MFDSKNLVWDTCVFSRFIIGNPSEYVPDIEAYIADAKSFKRTIYFSSVVLAEIRQSAATFDKEEELDEFLADLSSAFVLIDANPVITMLAGRLRAVQSTHPSNDAKAGKRVFGVGDAIHLATALYLRNSLGMSDVVFHTLDEGKGRTWEGKCLPLLKFEEWFPQATRTKHIQAACDLPRSKPIYPQPSLDFGAKDGKPIVPHKGH